MPTEGARRLEPELASAASAGGPAHRMASPLSAWWALTVLLLLYALSMIDRSILPMLATPIKRDLGLSDFEMSFILGPAFAVCYAIAGFPLGWAADHFPRRWVIFAGTVMWSASTAACGLASSFTSLFIARVGVGGGEASLTPSAFSMLADLFPPRRLTTVVAIYQTGIRIGASLALALGGLTIAYATSISHHVWPVVGVLAPWQLTLLIVGVPGASLGLLLFTLQEPQRGRMTAHLPADTAGLWQFLKDNRALMLLLLSGFSLISVSAMGTNAWVPSFIERAYGWMPAQYGPAMAGVALVGVAALIMKGAFVDWLFSRGVKDAHIRFYLWLLIIAIPLSGAMYFVSNPYAFIGIDAIVSLVMGGFNLYCTTIITLISPPNLRGRLSALFLSAFFIAGGGIGPVIVGAITTFIVKDEAQLGWALAVTGSSSLTVAFIILLFTLPRIRAAVTARAAATAAHA